MLGIDGECFWPRICWTRHFTGWSIPGTESSEEDWYVRDQWSALATTLRATATARTVNPTPDPVGPDRASQLLAAVDAGLTVPMTLVTSDPTFAAQALPGQGDLMVKSLGAHFLEASPGDLLGIFPRRVTRAELASADIERAPVMVQEFLPASSELRIYGIGGEFFCFEVKKGAAEELWTRPDEVMVREIPMVEHLRSSLARLAALWHLDVAAFDLLRTPGHDVFLEVNVLCDWRWFEERAGTSAVSRAVSSWLEKLFRGLP
jgi:glutathione synthase/RimK-type ligase-like ATP-grasp enzyme